MVMDFFAPQHVVGGWIDEHLDHQDAVATGMTPCCVLPAAGGTRVRLGCQPDGGDIARLIFERPALPGIPGGGGQAVGDGHLLCDVGPIRCDRSMAWFTS